MGILDTIMNFIYQIICSFYDKFFSDKLDICKLITVGEETTSPESSQICPQDTCSYDQSREYTMEYSSELNLNSSCDDIKDYILSNLESINPDAFHSSDETPITNSMKKELIYVLENRTDMITNGGSSSPGIRFKFCCPTEQHCLL